MSIEKMLPTGQSLTRLGSPENVNQAAIDDWEEKKIGRD
jgi:hypothetical protein